MFDSMSARGVALASSPCHLCCDHRLQLPRAVVNASTDRHVANQGLDEQHNHIRTSHCVTEVCAELFFVSRLSSGFGFARVRLACLVVRHQT